MSVFVKAGRNRLPIKLRNSIAQGYNLGESCECCKCCFIKISKDEKMELLDKLKDSRHNMSENDVEASDYYKVNSSSVQACRQCRAGCL
jgi:hypothetical protein